MSSSFESQVQALQERINKQESKIASKEKCLPTMLIAGIVVPFLLWALLYFLQPSFVQKKDGTKYIRDGTKVFYYTVGITLVIWVAMYLFTYCQGYDKASMLCARK